MTKAKKGNNVFEGYRLQNKTFNRNPVAKKFFEEANYSAGMYDLSISNQVDHTPLTSDYMTVRTTVKFFFSTPEGKQSGLDPDLYGHTYILGFIQAGHVYDKEKTDKVTMVTMAGKSVADKSPNDLPSQKSYGFKSPLKFPIFTKAIESYVVINIDRNHTVKKPRKLPIYDSPITKVTKYDRKDAKHSDLGFQGRQTTKSTIKGGGGSKEHVYVSNQWAYASRIYKGDKRHVSHTSDTYQFFITPCGDIFYKVNNKPPKKVGRIFIGLDDAIKFSASLKQTTKEITKISEFAEKFANKSSTLDQIDITKIHNARKERARVRSERRKEKRRRKHLNLTVIYKAN